MKSEELAEQASHVLVGGVSCGWNSMKDFGATHVKKAEGAHIWDVDGKEYIDYSMGWASLFLGHTPEFYEETIKEAMGIGFGLQYETEYHVKLAKLLTEVIPSAEKVRFTNTGTESTMYAIKMARAYTGKEKIIKFEGHFHGVNDYLNFSNDAMDKLGQRRPNGSIDPLPGSSGIPSAMKDYVISLQYNDIDSFYKVIEEEKDSIAGVILEPICLASVIMFPQDDFLEKIRKVCDDVGIVLVFDEVMAGFREQIGGVQSYYNVVPDITTISKVMGCGFIISAIVGKSKFMDILDPVGNCVASGTNTGRLLSVIGSYKALTYLREHSEVYDKNNENSKYFMSQINEIGARNHVPLISKGFGGRIVIHFGATELKDNYEDVVRTWNREYHMKCYHQAYENGLFSFLMPLSICSEPITITPAHERSDIDKTLDIFETILKKTNYR